MYTNVRENKSHVPNHQPVYRWPGIPRASKNSAWVVASWSWWGRLCRHKEWVQVVASARTKWIRDENISDVLKIVWSTYDYHENHEIVQVIWSQMSCDHHENHEKVWETHIYIYIMKMTIRSDKSWISQEDLNNIYDTWRLPKSWEEPKIIQVIGSSWFKLVQTMAQRQASLQRHEVEVSFNKFNAEISW